MSKELDKELTDEMTRITRTVNPDDFRRDQHLIPNNVSQLNRIDRMLKKLAELPLTKKQAE